MDNPAFVKDSASSGETANDLQNKRPNLNKRRILKNVILLSVAFMVLFTSYQSMATLQSSINQVDGLGTYSLCLIYGALIVSSQFTPSLAVKYLGSKWTMVACMMCYSLYIGAQFYPQYYTLLPTAILVGAAAAPLWIAKCNYLTKVGDLHGDEGETAVVRFFGIFFSFFQTSLVWGSLIASFALGIGREKNSGGEESKSICGVNFCPWSLQQEDSEIEEANFQTTTTQIYTLAGIYLACSLLAPLIIAAFLDPLSKLEASNEIQESSTGFQLLIATARHMRKKEQLLLIPLTIWSGLEQGFFGADFTAGYVSCAWGVDKVGYVVVTYGVFDAGFSLGLSLLIAKIGRVAIFLIGATLNLAVIMFLFLWRPNSEQAYFFFIVAALWGISDAVWQTQINAFYGIMFTGSDSTGGFSNYRLWESVGFIIAYILQTQVCVSVKLWVLVLTLGLGMIGYLIVEWNRKPK